VTQALWVTPDYPWEGDSVSGVFYQTQARALAGTGIGITVVIPTPWAPWPLPRMNPSWQRYASAPVSGRDQSVEVLRVRYPAFPGEPRWAIPDRLMARATLAARASWRGARLVHGHSAVTSIAAWRVASRARLPLALTFHGSDLNTWPERNPGSVPHLRAAIRAADLVIAVSPPLAARVAALAGIEAVVLPLGSDHHSIAASAMPCDEARTALDLVDERVVVLFVGNLVDAKGVRELADAVRAMSERFLAVFVGEGPLADYGRDDRDGERCLRFRGAVPHDLVGRYMSAADVLVLPSRREGLPTVLVEAGSLGLPVIATGVGGIPGLIGDGRGTILPDGSAGSIRAALIAFERNRTTAAAMAMRLRDYVRAEHDADTNAGRLRDLYSSVWSTPLD
jgi:teichuronic acid biosynthesis glycosyltransferase TuaC